jgi:hypothetical protein
MSNVRCWAHRVIARFQLGSLGSVERGDDLDLGRSMAPATGHASTCPCRKLHPAIVMMKSAEDRPRCDVTKPLDRTNKRRILTQG